MQPTWTRDAIADALRAEYAATGRTPVAEGWRKGAYGRPHAVTVCRRFGSWNKALRYAGLPVNRRRGPSPTWTRSRIVDAMLDWLGRHMRWPTSYEWRSADPDGRWPASVVVVKRFGSWKAAKRAAGWTG